MTDSFMSYSEDFEQFRDDAAQDIRALSDATSKASREELAERAMNNISEAERYLRILENELSAGDSQERRRMHQQLRSYKSQINKLKANLDRAKLMDTAKQRQEPTNDPREIEAQYQQLTDRIDDHLGDAQAIIAHTEATAQNITTNLQDQREHFINVRDNVDRTHQDTREADKHLKSLRYKMIWQILVLYFIIFGLLVFIIWKIINKFG